MNKKLYAGDAAPDIALPCAKCGEFILSDEIKTSPVLLYFYPADYGLMCTYFMQVMNEFFEAFEKAGIKVFPISPDTIESHLRWMEHTRSKYDHISDAGQEASRLYGMLMGHEGPGVTPMTNRGFVLIDQKMTIRHVWRAEIAANIPDLVSFIPELQRALKGEG